MKLKNFIYTTTPCVTQSNNILTVYKGHRLREIPLKLLSNILSVEEIPNDKAPYSINRIHITPNNLNVSV